MNAAFRVQGQLGMSCIEIPELLRPRNGRKKKPTDEKTCHIPRRGKMSGTGLAIRVRIIGRDSPPRELGGFLEQELLNVIGIVGPPICRDKI